MSIRKKLDDFKSRIFHGINQKTSELDKIKKDINDVIEIAYKDLSIISSKRSQLQKEQKEFDKAIEEKFDYIISCFEELKSYGKKPKIIDAYINACFILDERLARYFVKKQRPSIRSAEIVSELKKEKKEYLNRIKDLEYQLSELWGDDINTSRDDDFEIYDDDEERANFLLSKEQYNLLSTQEKYQRALDNYWNSNYSNSYIGKMYERYIGYRYEQEGYAVEYRGIEKGLKDGGVDLVCIKGTEMLLVQCKNWKQESTIYEKHICQLYGSSAYWGKVFDSRDSKGTIFQETMLYHVVPVFVSTTKLDERAKEVADKLGVLVDYVPFRKGYPIIKCNISNDGEKIYHLPFDQMYDKTKIDKNGECYVATVKEAEDKGFRRARRHYFT